MRLAISYIRYSTPAQKLGDSKRRQLDETQKFCDENSLVLDRRLMDEGKSAYKGKHRLPGTDLARFLKEVEEAKIPKGAVLIVESLDRLSREEVPIALELFLRILRAGIDIVTLIDRQWYSHKTLGSDSAPLLISIICMMRAHDEVKHRAARLGAVWEKKRQTAKTGLPMTSICPGWLMLAPDKKSYNPILERVKLVRLVYWLFNRGWSRQRITALLNRHAVPTWGVGNKAAKGWHVSYIQKILNNRAVLGEFIPHTTRQEKGSEVSVGPRRPVSAVPIKGYYPQIVTEAAFQKAQLRAKGPRGPVGTKIANLFQGLLKDGNHPEFTMCFKDHGDKAGKWRYVYSDYHRVDPDSQLFSWNYNSLETTLLNYLGDLDWSQLTVGKDAAIRKLRDDLAVLEGRLQELDTEVKRLVGLAKLNADVKEISDELAATNKQRGDLRLKIASLKTELRARQEFTVADGSVLIKRLASDKKNPLSRLKLRDAIRRFVTRIELFPALPERFTKQQELPMLRTGGRLEDLLQGRCARFVFANGEERWVVDGKSNPSVRIEGKRLPPKKRVVVNWDDLAEGHLVKDMLDDSARA